MADFLVINQLSAFNAVLNKPSLRALKAITNIYHLLMKFPTPNGLGKVHGNQNKAKECYNQAVKNSSRPRQENIVDQRPPSKGSLDNTIDPRLPDDKATTRPIEDLVDLPVETRSHARC